MDEHSSKAEWIRSTQERFEGPLTRYATRLTGDIDRARDVVQDTFLRLCAEEPSRVRERLAQWLFTVCHNRALDVRMKESRMNPLNDRVDLPRIDSLKYQKRKQLTPAAESGELLTVKLRYEEPDGDKSKLLMLPIIDEGATLSQASKDCAFASGVASIGMILRDSPYKGEATFESVIELANVGKVSDEHGYRAEFINLVKMAKEIH